MRPLQKIREASRWTCKKKLFLMLIILFNILLLGIYFSHDHDSSTRIKINSKTCKPTSSRTSILNVFPSNYSKHVAIVQLEELIEKHTQTNIVAEALRHNVKRSDGLVSGGSSSSNNSNQTVTQGGKSDTLSESVIPSNKGMSESKHSTRLKNALTVAIALGITSATLDPNMNKETMLKKFPTFSQLLPSFCNTVSCGYTYSFYFAFDIDDAFFVQDHQKKMFVSAVKQKSREWCPKGLSISVNMIQCYHSHHPAWAQNDAVYAAYLDNVDYTYRVNDDSYLKSSGWVEEFIRTLQGMSPPNVGVVGPNHQGGATDILTYDFTHHSHMEIFGFHYPRLFTDWTGDSWITAVYKPGRLVRLKQVHLVHSQVLGRRYDYHSKSKELKSKVNHDKDVIRRYLVAMENLENNPAIQPDPAHVIAISLYGSNYNYTNGAIRNAQLIRVFFPTWTLRIYVPNPETSPSHLCVPARYISKLLDLRAQVQYVDLFHTLTPSLSSLPSSSSSSSSSSLVHTHFSPKHMNLLVSLDPSVKRFLIRHADYRFGDRESELVSEWVKSDSVLHCIRDNDHQRSASIVPGLYGAIRSEFIQLLSVPVIDLLAAVHDQNHKWFNKSKIKLSMNVEDVIWDKMKNNVLYHDSTVCEGTDYVHFQPRTGFDVNYIGEIFDGFGEISNPDFHRKITPCTPGL